MENKSHAIAAGAFVLLVSALVIALAAWLSRDNKMRDVYELTTRDSVTGLSPQSAVRYRGISVGKVDSIEFDPQLKGNVLVTLMVDDTTPITKSTYASLGYQGVTGLAYVQLDDDGKSTEHLPTSRNQPARLPLRPGLLSKLTDQGGNILLQVEETTKRLNQLLSPENQKVLVGAMQSTSQSAAQVGAMSQRVQTIMDAQFGPERANIPLLVKNTSDTMKSMQGSLAEFNKTVQEAARTAQEATRAAVSVTALGNKVAEKDGVLDQMSQSASVLTQTAGALAQSAQNLSSTTLPRLSRAAEDTGKSARNIDRVFTNLGDNPQSLIYGSGTPTPGPGEPGFTAPKASALADKP